MTYLSFILILGLFCLQIIVAKMSSVEQPCYTLINISSDYEMPNEMQLKADLGLF